MKYPTIGPTGLKKMNVNGLACGIEMYLGEDILKFSKEFAPIQWKGYNEKENKYQGEIANKGLIQTKFREKLKLNCLTRNPEMELLLSVIFNAFKM